MSAGTILVALLEALDVAKRIARLTPKGLKLTPEAARALDELENAAKLLDVRGVKAMEILSAEADHAALASALRDQRAETLRIAEERWGKR